MIRLLSSALQCYCVIGNFNRATCSLIIVQRSLNPSCLVFIQAEFYSIDIDINPLRDFSICHSLRLI